MPYRIEVFVWAALLGKINTKSKLASLGIIPSSEAGCVFCNNAIEDHSHLLLHCSFSWRLWQWWIDIWGSCWVYPFSLSDAMISWHSPYREPFFKKVWLASFFIILWTLWKERNARVFSQKSSTPEQLQHLVLLRLCWWIKWWSDPFPYSPEEVFRHPPCLRWGGSKCLKTTHLPNPSSAQWTPPPSCAIKWNVDASTSMNLSRSAVGGVLRNHLGVFMCLFSCLIPHMEINSAEVWVIHRAINIILSKDEFRRHEVIIESDSLNIVSWCNGNKGGPWNLSFQLNFIRNSLKKWMNISIIHKGRESNFVADSLAKLGIPRLDDFVAWI